jgi:hypothetical protein
MKSTVALAVAIPLTVFHFALEYLVHVQFGMLSELTWDHYYENWPTFPCYAMFVYSIAYISNKRLGKLVLLAASTLLGNRLLFLTIEKATYGYMTQAPSVLVLWIFLIIVMDLGLVLTSLTAVAAYHRRAYFEPLFASVGLKNEL